MKSARALALASLRRWRSSSEFADQVISDSLGQSGLSAPDRAFALELFYGILRNLTLLDFWIGQLRSEALDLDARNLLRLGLYQILLIDTAEHAAVFETVDLAPLRVRPLINAILRRALREKIPLTTAVSQQPLAVRYSAPDFLIEKWTQQFGREATIDLCRWNNQPAPVYARVNLLKITPAEFLQKYPGSIPLPENPRFVTMPNPAAALAAGDCYVQDPSTAIACELLQPQPNESVLDACAAPGGKSAYLAALMKNTGALVAADRENARLERLRGNVTRLGLTNTRIVQCDWLHADSIPAESFTEQSFDRILLDAPCSNTGVMRRRVDVRWRLRKEDFVRMPLQQLALLEKLAPLLRPGGSLVYSTCSLEPEENEKVVEKFLRAQPAFRLTNSKKSLPWHDRFDGAFAACLHRPIAME